MAKGTPCRLWYERRMTGAEPFVVLRGGGETLRGPAGGPARILARAETTSSGFTALENIIATQQGPPEHIHVREDDM
jgi:hypothetical protein